jgi:uncharacterized protein (TIGR02231 family)
MKYYILSFFLLSFTFNTQAQNQEKVTLREATVFLHGAELMSTANINLHKGENEIVFTNIATEVNPQSITIGTDKDASVMSAVYKVDYLSESEVTSLLIKMIKDSLDFLNEDNVALGNKISVQDEILTTLKDNHLIKGQNTGVSVAELQKMMDLIATKMNTLLTEKSILVKKQQKNNERIQRLNNQLQQEQENEQYAAQIAVKFYSTEAATTTVRISYVTRNAGWAPTYEVRADKISDSIRLQYKANVYQNTGIKWDKIQLALSTGNPNEGVNAPLPTPWYLQTSKQELSVYSPRAAVGTGSKYYVDGCLITGTSSVNDEHVQKLATNSTSMNAYVNIDNSGTATIFEIDIPYSVPSDGQQHLVDVKSYKLPVVYRYYAAPKLDRDAFLIAHVTQWSDINLLPAATSIFFEGTYVGQGYLDTRSVKDTLDISLGRDKKVIVRKERDKEYKSQKFIGNNKREAYMYTISVRNTKKVPVEVSIQDQLPVSNDKDIVVEDKEIDGGTIEETTGIVTWTMKVAPNETAKKKLGFTIKYPKDKTLLNN